MIIYPGASQPISAGGGTISGVQVDIMLLAAANNNQLVPGDFIPSLCTFQAILTRNGKAYNIFNTNLAVLATYWMRKMNLYRFTNGWNIVPPGSSVANQLQRTAYLDFGCNITLSGTDSLVLNVNFPIAAISANVAGGGSSFMNIYFVPSVGKSKAIPTTVAEVILQGTDNQDCVNQSGIIKCDFLNFDQSSFVNQVITNVGFVSDKLSYSAPWYVLYGQEQRKYSSNIPYQYGTALSTAGTSVVRGLDQLPQCLSTFMRGRQKSKLNNVSVSFTFNGTNVATAQNYHVYTALQMS